VIATPEKPLIAYLKLLRSLMINFFKRLRIMMENFDKIRNFAGLIKEMNSKMEK
jgi:hypothetical protein